MNLVRVGRVVRTLRRRRGWTQADLAAKAVVSQQAVSLLECARADHLSMRTVDRILAELEAGLDVLVRWRGGQLERVLDEGHSHLAGAVAERVERLGWLVRAEVTYSRFGERGSIDLLAYEPRRSALLVIEIKTELTSVEATLRKLDEKVRLSTAVARERFSWRPVSLSRMLVLPEGRTPRRHIDRHSRIFDRAFPTRGVPLRSWLRDPMGEVDGLLFVADTTNVGVSRDLTSRRRIRHGRNSGLERERRRAATD